jgi:hypothetical protein
MPVTLQRHLVGEKSWRGVSRAVTGAKGTRSWTVKQSRTTYYRVVSTGVGGWLGTTSATRALLVRR